MQTKRSGNPGAMLACGTLLAAAPAAAQDGGISLENRDHDAVYDGWSAERLLDEARVYGPDGEEIGSIENLLIDDGGDIVAIIAQIGGFWDLGDTHVTVPWDQAAFDGWDVQVPVTEDNVEDFSMFADEYFTRRDVGSLATVEDDVATGPNMWKATALFDDYAVLENGVGYGYINDLIFDDGGTLRAVVVNVDAGSRIGSQSGYYAYPWYGFGYDDYDWEAGQDTYVLPFDEREISDFTTAFDYGELGDGLG